MKKVIFLLFLANLFLSCGSDAPQEKIDNLNGYWEITKAELPEGVIKEFKFSELVDFIKVDSAAGFRKKLRPQLDGSFIASEDVEIFEIKLENDSINLYYSTPYANWKESIISSEENELVVLNQDGIIYTYKRFTPYSGNYGQEDQ
ncbi:lipocalin family protein [Salinimicrobium sp. CAU 1759]